MEEIAIKTNQEAGDGTTTAVILAEVTGIGFDAYNLEYVDMIGHGIVDPVKVTRLALESAVSAAGTVLTANAGLADIKKDVKK